MSKHMKTSRVSNEPIKDKNNDHKIEANNDKAKDFKGTFKKLMKYMGSYKIGIIIVMIITIISTLFAIVGPKILGMATTKLYEGVVGMASGTGTGIDFEAIANILIALLVLYAVSSLFAYIQGYIMSNISIKITYRLRNEIVQKINRMPLKYFDKTNNGEILSRITNDVETLSQSLNQSVAQVITSITMAIGILLMMFSIAWQMTLVAIAILPVSLIFITAIVKKSQKHFKSQQKFLGHLNGHVEEMYGGHKVMKAFNGEVKSVEKFDEYNNVLYDSAWKSQFLSGLMMPIMNFVSNLGYVAICILGGYMAINNGLTLGNIQAFLQYVRQFLQPVMQITTISAVLQQTAASAERVFEFLEEEEDLPESKNPVTLMTSETEKFDDMKVDIKGSVQFAHVSFGYDPNKMIINDFSVNIKNGEKVAIVGPTGAGKTTLVKLLMRFYDVNEGAILVDGYSIKEFRRNDLRSIFGMVLQDAWLYNGTIRENIRYGKLGSTDEEVEEAAKIAQADHFIRTLPDGYDTVLNEETGNISQGEKQLLTIARAVLANPNILILDEATSSVDTRTETLIQKAMDNLMQGRTSFVIAHRLSTIKNADMILVLNEGNIVEQGTHKELLEKQGFYSNLYNSQFES